MSKDFPTHLCQIACIDPYTQRTKAGVCSLQCTGPNHSQGATVMVVISSGRWLNLPGELCTSKIHVIMA